MGDAFTPTQDTVPSRHKDRIRFDRAAVLAVIDEALVSHLGFISDGKPVVLPQLHARVGDVLYFHASTGARLLRQAYAEGIEVCVTMTILDGLVLARSAFAHSMNYRCVVVHGLAEVVTDPAEKDGALDALVEAIVPGRSADVRRPSAKESSATALLRLPIDNASLKVRQGPPLDEEDDLSLPYWAGSVPIELTAHRAVPDPRLSAGVEVPDYVHRWRPGRTASP